MDSEIISIIFQMSSFKSFKIHRYKSGKIRNYSDELIANETQILNRKKIQQRFSLKVLFQKWPDSNTILRLLLYLKFQFPILGLIKTISLLPITYSEALRQLKVNLNYKISWYLYQRYYCGVNYDLPLP